MVPITLIVMGISVLLVPLELGTVVMFFVGALMLIVGMGFFQLGAEISMTPMGKGIGSELAGSRRLPVILGVGFLMGAIITMAEPDLQVLAESGARHSEPGACAHRGGGRWRLSGAGDPAHSAEDPPVRAADVPLSGTDRALVFRPGGFSGGGLRLRRRDHRPDHRSVHHGHGRRSGQRPRRQKRRGRQLRPRGAEQCGAGAGGAGAGLLL